MHSPDLRKMSKEGQYAIRTKAIEHWIKHNNMSKTSEDLSVPYVTVRKWVKAYRMGGSEALSEDKRGRPSGRELTPPMARRIIRKITDRNPEQLKLPFALWTRETVATLIEREFGIRRSARQVGRYLEEWGFSPQKPAYKAYEQNPKAVRQWLDKEYPAIVKAAKSQKGVVFWGDETGFRSKDTRGRSFAPIGKTPIIEKTGKQFGVNMISAVSNLGKLYFMLFSGGINSEKLIRFLKLMVKSCKRKVFLILDNLPTHKTKLVQEWVRNNSARIELHFLPPYSPELNPDEYLNQDLKASIAGKPKPRGKEQLEAAIKDMMGIRKRRPNHIRGYFNNDNVRYAA